ncbi:fibroblast growth factor receptor-like 1 isoform X2 [Folsomia candida]|uniref:fibroblast growth factor receptor-like 1 isoform X2 n=1 Tax=Folsomia candida TaxID=158441 RepID=UPI000B8F4607|nr:fibroblast growth factor receptor-like 1 isoform X2 [Folsomia candida]
MMDERAASSRFQSVMVICLLILMGAEMLTALSPVRKASDQLISGAPADRTSRKIVAELKDVELQCPIPHVQQHVQHVEWYKQNPGGRGKKRITQFRNRYELSNGEIKIHSLTTEDGGTYVCKVGNKSELHFIQLIVSGEQTIKTNHLKISQNRKGSSSEEAYSEPHIAKNLLPKQKVYHQAKGQPIVFLKCESSGNPKPTITWYKNGAMVSSSTTNVSTLKLLNVSQVDSGLYKCEAVNLFGISRYEVTIQVTDYWFGASEILELTPRNVTVTEGATVNISCIAKFEMNPWFSWVRKVASNKTESNKVFFHLGTSSYYEVLKSTVMKPRGENGVFSTDLLITNVTRNDSGVYYCAVAGLQGYNLSEATITVEPGSHIKGMAAQWAILWTISFIFLVMLVILCFVNLYGCRPHKPTIKPVSPTNSKSQHCHLPESSPLTMSTQCTTQESFVPLMVGGGGGGSGSYSGLSSFAGDSFESDYDSPSASNVLIYQHQHHPRPISSWGTSNASSTGHTFYDHKSYRPNSICSDYQCNSSVSNPTSSQCHMACCHHIGGAREIEVHRPRHHVHHHHKSLVGSTRSSSKNYGRQSSSYYYNPHHPPACPSSSPWQTNYPTYEEDDYYPSTDCESCVQKHDPILSNEQIYHYQ